MFQFTPAEEAEVRRRASQSVAPAPGDEFPETPGPLVFCLAAGNKRRSTDKKRYNNFTIGGLSSCFKNARIFVISLEGKRREANGAVFAPFSVGR